MPRPTSTETAPSAFLPGCCCTAGEGPMSSGLTRCWATVRLSPETALPASHPGLPHWPRLVRCGSRSLAPWRSLPASHLGATFSSSGCGLIACPVAPPGSDFPTPPQIIPLHFPGLGMSDPLAGLPADSDPSQCLPLHCPWSVYGSHFSISQYSFILRFSTIPPLISLKIPS